MNTSQVQAFEDSRWGAHDQVPLWRHEAALRLVMEEPVLDVAGGDGLFSLLLQEQRGIKCLTMIDLSPVGVEKARLKGLMAEVVDISKPLPFDDNSFGTACALDVLEHLYDPLLALQEMARVARSVVIVVPNFHYWKERAQMVVGQVPFQCKPKRGHVHWFNYAALQVLIGQARLRADAVMFGGFVRLGGLGRWLAEFHPSLFAHSFAMRLKKT